MRLSIHTFLLAIYPVLALLAYNIDELTVSDATRSIIVVATISLLLLALLRLLTKEWLKSSLIESFLLLLFFSYGHVYASLKAWQLTANILGRHRVLLPFYVVLGSLWIAWVLLKARNPRQIAIFFNVTGLVLVAIPVFTILRISFQEFQSAARIEQTSQNQQTVNGSSFPDIYYIILDGYGRADVLSSLYNYDNSAFLNALTERGFYIAQESYSNYVQTALSLASSMNLDYLDDLKQDMGTDSRNRWPLSKMIKKSLIGDLLKNRGYQIIAIESGYEITNLVTADQYWSKDNDTISRASSTWNINSFESILLDSTILRVALDLRIISVDLVQEKAFEYEYQQHRERILYALDVMGDVPKMEGDYFLFAHILAPHPPFVFDENGSAKNPQGRYSLMDGSHYTDTREAYMQGYRAQVEFLNSQILPMIDSILAHSNIPPIIILQADHGPGAHLVWSSAEKSNLKERLGILNAYFLPNGGAESLYSSITPVNTFRLIMNQYFDKRYELLPDKMYFSPWKQPYNFIPVTNQLAGQ